MRRLGIGGLVLVLAVAAIAVCGQEGRELRDQASEETGPRLLLNPDRYPGLDLGIPGAVAALIYLDATAELGEATMKQGLVLSDEFYAYLADKIEIVSRLDPYQFNSAIVAFGALSRVTEVADTVLRILLANLSHQMGEWELYFFTGATYYFDYGQQVDGAQWFSFASIFPKAPDYLANLSQLVQLRETGKVDKVLTAVIKEQLTDRRLRREWDQIERFLDQRDLLMRDIDAFREARGRPPESAREMVAAGYWLGIPRDPWGGRIRLTEDGSTILASRRVPLATTQIEPRPIPPEIRSGRFLQELR